jgi:copper chaperone
METLKFKTNIKCSGCVAKVTSNLNATAGEGNWEVDLMNPAKVLTVKNAVDVSKIKEAVEKAGYQAEKI